MFWWPCFRFLINIAICLSCSFQLHIHWVPLRTSKNIQRKLLVLSGCSFLPKLSTFMPLILMQRDLLVVSGNNCNNFPEILECLWNQNSEKPQKIYCIYIASIVMRENWLLFPLTCRLYLWYYVFVSVRLSVCVCMFIVCVSDIFCFTLKIPHVKVHSNNTWFG